MPSQDKKEWKARRVAAGKYGNIAGTYRARKLFSLSKYCVRYWRKKTSNRLFHPNQHGGHRYSKFAPYEHQQIRLYVWFLCNEEPTRKLQNYVEELSDIGYNCSKEFVRAIFKEWRWSWKKPSNKQLQKYTQENLKRYADYVEWISEQDLRKLKFADEVHFVSNSVSRRRVLGPIDCASRRAF